MGSAPVSKTVKNLNRSIVWLDISVNDTEENRNAQQLLRTPMNDLKIYIDDKECEKYIRSVSKEHRIILIVGGRSGQLIVSRIQQLAQVSSIFVYCMDKRNEEWTKIYNKIKGVIEEINELVIQVLSAQEKQTSPDRFNEPLSINIYHASETREQSTTELNGQFVHSQILIDCLIRMKSPSTDRNEFINYCKKEYLNDNLQLNIIREFQEDYSADRALTWYTRDCFLYRLLNKALRVQNIDLLYFFGFFIRDLQHQLEQNQYPSLIHVYRGQLMSKKEVQQLKKSMGQLISMNSFLSTTLEREVAVIFSGNTEVSNNDCQAVLFEIEADPRVVGVESFANITPYSYMADEEEVLMMLGSIFRLVHICYEGNLCIIQLLLCSKNGHDIEPIFNQMKIDYHGKGNTNAGVFGIVLGKMGKFDEAEKYIQRALKEPSSDHHTEKTNVFNLSVHYKNLGNVAVSKGDTDSGLDCFHKALKIRLQIVKSDDPSIAEIHHDIGGAYFLKGDYKRALKSYDMALTINRQAFSEDNYRIAASLSNIGSVHSKQGQYIEALRYLQEALAIREKHLPGNHHMLGESHTNIATTYRYLGNLDLALEHYNTALNILKKCLPSQHPSIAALYNGIGTIYSDKRNYQQALLYFEKSVAIFRQTVPPTHPDVINVERNISGVRDVLPRHK